jgi:hypothetical protein
VANITIGLGIVLIVLGVGGYFGTDRASWTALIPAFLGGPLLLLGLLALKDNLRKHAMHAAVVLGLLGFLGTIPGLVKLVKMAFGVAPERPVAVYMQSIMAVLCGLFVVLCVRSFIAARRSRARSAAAREQPPAPAENEP